MFSYYVRFFLMVAVCVFFGAFQSFANFDGEMEEVLGSTHSLIPPTTKKMVESSPSGEQEPLAFTVDLPEIRKLPSAEGNRFFDDPHEQDKHSIYQFSLQFKGISPDFMSYIDKESGKKQRVKIRTQYLGFLDIKIVHNRETDQRIAYLDEVNFEPHVQGLGLGHIALTFFTQFVDALNCDISFLKLLSNEPHTYALYEKYGFVFTQRSVDKIIACRFSLDNTRKNSGETVAAVMEKYSPLKMVRTSRKHASAAPHHEPLSPTASNGENSTPLSPPSPFKGKARRRLNLPDDDRDAGVSGIEKENRVVADGD